MFAAPILVANTPSHSHSNAGKFTTNGVIEVDVRLLPDPSQPGQTDPRAQYAAITVRNPRRGTPLGDTEELFIPFRGMHSTQGRAVRRGTCVRG
jgi:signal transduction histidine kinase